jgi:hypothetical protein
MFGVAKKHPGAARLCVVGPGAVCFILQVASSNHIGLYKLEKWESNVNGSVYDKDVIQ